MRKKMFILSLWITALLAVAACRETNAQSPSHQTETLTPTQAQQIATGFLEGSTFESLETGIYNGKSVFEVTVSHGDNKFHILINREAGELVKMTLMEPQTSVPETAIRELSREEAILLAEAHLDYLGITGARLEYARLTTENGRQVWDIEFEANDRDLEFYVDIQSGEFLKAPTDNVSTNNQAPSEPAVNEPDVVTREQAADIALALVPGGTLIEVDRDIERGRSTWYVAIRDGNRIHEIYVDRTTGEIVLHESEIDD